MATADIVIIGSGIIGTSIAYQLAQRGARNLVILERDSIASGSSGRATGGIRQQFADEYDIRFSIEGVRFYTQFIREYADQPDIAPPQFHQHGYLFLVTSPQRWQDMQQYVALQQACGAPTQLLTPTDVQRRVPQLNVDDVIGATLCPTDGYSDPGAMTLAIAKAAQSCGVSIREHSPVTAIHTAHGRVEAVQTPHETIHTRLVVNATGAYASLTARLAGIADLPVYPLRRQLYLTEPFADLPDDVPMVVDQETGFHFRRRGERVVLALPLPISQEEEECCRQLDEAAFNLQVDDTSWNSVYTEIQRRCPTLLHAQIERAWAGFYEMTPDEHPILGQTEVAGFLCACGFSGHGFMHTPMAAKLLTELILDGTCTTFPIELFSLERFRTGKLLTAARLL